MFRSDYHRIVNQISKIDDRACNLESIEYAHKKGNITDEEKAELVSLLDFQAAQKDQYGLTVVKDKHFPDLMHFHCSRDCHKEVVRYAKYMDRAYNFLSRYLKINMPHIPVYVLNEPDWKEYSQGKKIDHSSDQWMYGIPYTGKLIDTERGVFFTIFLPKESSNKLPLRDLFQSIIYILGAHELTHDFLKLYSVSKFGARGNVVDLSGLPKELDKIFDEALANIVAFEVSGNKEQLTKIVESAILECRKMLRLKDDERLNIAEAFKRSRENKAYYIAAQVMIWQGIVEYYKQNAFGDLLKDGTVITKNITAIIW